MYTGIDHESNKIIVLHCVTVLNRYNSHGIFQACQYYELLETFPLGVWNFIYHL
jgi:hypothetical protein